MDIAISLNMFVPTGNALQMIPRVAVAGFMGDFPFCDLLPVIDWDDAIAAGRMTDAWLDAGEGAGMKWVQAHGPMFNMFGRPGDVERGKRMTAIGLRAAGRLGVKWMVLHPDVFPGCYDAEHQRAVRSANVAFFREFLPVCEQSGVGIAVENIFDAEASEAGRGCPHYFGARAQELCELIDAVNHPLFGACWDTGHGKIMKADQRASLAMLGHRLKALHIQETDGSDDSHLLPFAVGRGGVDWSAVTAGLRDARFPGPFTYEVHKAISALPEELIDPALTYAAQIARHLAGAASATGVSC